MRLNIDCVRDILLTVEEECDFQTRMRYSKCGPKQEKLQKYSHDEIIYHVNQCDLADLIVDLSIPDSGDFFSIGDLSPEGHKFLANIREDTVWNGVKTVAGKVGSTSLSAVTQIASNVITQLIKSQFGLT